MDTSAGGQLKFQHSLTFLAASLPLLLTPGTGNSTSESAHHFSSCGGSLGAGPKSGKKRRVRFRTFTFCLICLIFRNFLRYNFMNSYCILFQSCRALHFNLQKSKNQKYALS